MTIEQNSIKLDVRVYPINEPKGNTVAFASVTINDIIAINGIRVVDGSNGLFVAMPQAKDAIGEFRDIAFPVTKELRLQLNKTILDEYTAQKSSVKEQIKEGVNKAPSKTIHETEKCNSTKKVSPEH